MEIVDLKELSLKKVRIAGDVIGKFGTFEIEQEYKNNTNKVLEVSYTFPIVETATVVGFEIDVEGKVLKGVCKEKGEAKKEYVENMVKGNSSFLMEQETDNIFKISIGKIDVNETVKLKIYYIDKFEIVDNNIQLLIPTLVAPKYKSDITSKLAYSKVDYTVDFNIRVHKNINSKNINSLSHKVNIFEEDLYKRVEVLNYDLSKDFKLNIELKNELISNAVSFKGKDNKNVLYLSFMPEIMDSYEDSEKEYVFLVDVSGSMQGVNLKETKHAVIECLKQLDEGDKFNIVPFESNFKAMSMYALDYNEENLKKAIKYVNELEATGGTEILNPIKFALYEKDVEKIVLLFTDGQVGNEAEILRYVEKNIGKSRMFPFGIDTNVNSSFIKQLGRIGHGKSELIQPHEKIDDKIIRTFSRIQTPLVEQIRIDYGNNKVLDEIREENVLFNYEFFNTFVKIEELVDDIYLKGKILDKEYSWKILKEDINNTNIDLELLFAKEEINRLENYIINEIDGSKTEIYKNLIIEIATKYNINSKYTSFITIYERENKIFDIPEYQNILLSDKETSQDGAIFKRRCSSVMHDVDMCYEEELDIPCFLRKNKSKGFFSKLKKESIEEPEVPQKTKEEIMVEMIDEYYKEILLEPLKNVLTYLLYARYYLKIRKSDFNYTTFFEFINNNKEIIINEEKYMKIIYSCYFIFKDQKRNEEMEKILDYLGNDYRKAIETGLYIDTNVEWDYEIVKKIKEKEDKAIVIRNINYLLDYLYDIAPNSSWVTWRK